MEPAPSAGQGRAHGLRVRKQAEMMGITPGTSRLAQQTGQEKWVSAPVQRTAAKKIPRHVENEDVDMMPYEAAGDSTTHEQVARRGIVASDEFFEGDPFQEAEEEEEYCGQEVRAEDILEADDYEDEDVEEEQLEIPPIVPPQRRAEHTRLKTPVDRLASQLPPVSSLVTKTEKPQQKPAAPRAAQDRAEPLAGWELFKVQKLSEADLRDTGAKAICRIKHGIRQPGAQKNGRPFIPADWETAFKPVLGSFKKFILGRPDQFRIITGAEPGFFTIAIVSNETVVAPSPETKGKGKKGFSKDKAKGKQWYDSKGGKGKGKAMDKWKGWSAKDKSWTAATPWGSAVIPAAPATPPGVGATRKAAPPPARAARLLAVAAKEALAQEEEENAQNQAEDNLWEEGEAADEEEMAEGEWQEDEKEEAAGAIIEDPIEAMWHADTEEAEVDEQPESPVVKRVEIAKTHEVPAEKPMQHGRFMSLLGGLGSKRPGSASSVSYAKRQAT